MCKLKLHMVQEPKSLRSSHTNSTRSSSENITGKNPSTSTDRRIGSSLCSTTSSSSAASSLASLRQALPANPNLYKFKELADATTQFTSGRLGNSSVWKCVLRGKKVALTVRDQKRKFGDFRSRLREICNAHHASIIKLLGACCEGDQVYLISEYVQGSKLGDCLQGSKVPGYTVLGSWISRMQIAVDVAKGLEYIHHDSNMNYVHNYVKSSSILVTEPGYRARLCHVGASYLAGEYEVQDIFDTQGDSNSGIRPMRRGTSVKITGTQGYMAPEYIESGILSQKTDVFSFGVVLLELLAGHEPVTYVQTEKSGQRLKRISLIDTLNIVFSEGGENFTVFSEGGENFTGRLRSWMDPRLKDSFPVDCAERVARIAASCVDADPGKRRDMRYIAGELSKVFIMSEKWSEQMEANKGRISATFEAR